VFEGLPNKNLPDNWLMPDVVVEANASVLLGPEPIIGRQDIVLSLANHPVQPLHIVTDGLSPFVIQSQSSPIAAMPSR
jgi:general secretion pathway protein H